MAKIYHYLFGPVPSRRFGLSLGVDLTPYKTCTLDCVFCQLGHTTNKTIKRKMYVPAEEVIAELKHWIDHGGKADYITLSGSGEPTLHSRFGDILQFINEYSDIPSVLLTNSTLLNLDEVCKAACDASVVKVSLSVWDNNSYAWINRPHEKLDFESLIQGLVDFRAGYHKEMRMEVFFMGGLNSQKKDAEKIAAIAKMIKPDLIELNTAVRPVQNDFVKPVTAEDLQSMALLFTPKAVVIPEFKSANKTVRLNEENLIEILKRRPCTLEQLSSMFHMHRNELAKYMGKLIGLAKIETIETNHTKYYKVNDFCRKTELSHRELQS